MPLVGIHMAPETMIQTYESLSEAQKLDHAYVKRMFGFAGLVWMLSVAEDKAAKASINGTIMRIEIGALKTAKELVAEWRASARREKDDALTQKYLEKAVESGIYEWEHGVEYYVKRMDTDGELDAWLASIKKKRSVLDDEYKSARETGAQNIAVLVLGKLITDLFILADESTQTLQDEADVRLARQTADIVGALSKMFEIPEAARYYPLAQVTRIADATLGTGHNEVEQEQLAVILLASFSVLFDMIGYDTARILCEFLAAIERRLAHDVADMMELFAKFVEDNSVFVALSRTARIAYSVGAGKVSPLDLVAMVAKQARQFQKIAKGEWTVADLAGALRGVSLVGAGRKVHTSIRVRAAALRSFAETVDRKRERAKATVTSREVEYAGGADLERARESRRDLLESLSLLRKRSVQITGGEVLVLTQEGESHVLVEAVVPGAYQRRRDAEGVFAPSLVSVRASVVGNATSWRGTVDGSPTGVCLILLDEGEDASRMREKLQLGPHDGWRPVARVMQDASVPSSGVVVMRAPDPPPRKKGEISSPRALVLVVDRDLARAIETALDAALEYAAEGSDAHRAAGAFVAQTHALMHAKEPRVCGVIAGVPKGTWTRLEVGARAREELRCMTDAMLLEYRIVRDTVRVFGLGAKLATSVLLDSKSDEPGAVARFAAWNQIAGFIARATLEKMVERRKRDLATGMYRELFEDLEKAVDAAWKAAVEYLEREPPDEPLSLLVYARFETERDQRAAKRALAAKRIERPALTWSEKETGGAGKKGEPIEGRIRAFIEARTRFGRPRYL
jgi:hypothetical protein